MMRVAPANISHYPHELPNLNPPVLIKQYVTEEFCDRMVAIAKQAAVNPSGVFGQDKSEMISNYFRTSNFCRMPIEVYDEMKRVLERMMAYFVNSDGHYASIKLCEGIQFLQYNEQRNGHFSAHTDNAYFDADGKFIYTSPKRTFTSVLYLNDDYEGGELILNSVLDENDQPIRLKPKKGEVVIFPSDVRFMHEVTPVTKGERYSVVGWYNAVRKT